MLFAAPIRYNRSQNQFEVLVSENINSKSLINVHIQRNEQTDIAFERLKQKLNQFIDVSDSEEVFKGYMYDIRQTDNAWIEAISYLFFTEIDDELEAADQESDLKWKKLDPSLINNLSTSQSTILRECLLKIKQSQRPDDDMIDSILKKTG